MKPKISIVTVTFNCEDHIRGTIESVIAQNYSFIEYIIIDGKSTDRTLSIISEYKDHIHMIVSEEDGGIYDAMNQGVIKATGDFINFMNAGDVFYNEYVISSLFDCENEHFENVDVIVGDAVAKFDGFTKVYKARYPSARNPMPFNHQAVFVRVDRAKEFPFSLNYKICSDRNFFMALQKKGAKFLVVEDKIAIIEAIGYSSSNSYKGALESLAILREHKSINNVEFLTRKILLLAKEFVRMFIPRRLMNLVYKITK
ncbi:glycosyltransferase family 2 protein [Parapedobacter sp. GCM10030251]|uniref:glycosyltransferase family 2 protein n=1 Tax=Parapedobacter sp. GCM10030251 TaxID=3273419 RepID=UPI003609C65F